MTSCGGMLSVTVRRSTLTIRSTIGIRMKRPGPFGSGSRRPSRKTIPRSYSRATLIAEIKNSTRSKSRIATMIKTALMASPFEVCEEGTGLEPVGELEQLLVDRITTCAWRLRRVVLVESGLFVARINHATANTPKHTADEELT